MTRDGGSYLLRILGGAGACIVAAACATGASRSQGLRGDALTIKGADIEAETQATRLDRLCRALTRGSRELLEAELGVLQREGREQSQQKLRELRMTRDRAPVASRIDASLAVERDREVRELAAAEDAGWPPRPTIVPWLPATLNECVKTTDGVYVATVDTLSDCRLTDAGDCIGYEKAYATWSIVYANLRGEHGAAETPCLTASDGPTANDTEWVNDSPKPVAFDFDGDGASELIFTFRYSPFDTKGEPDAWGTVLTFRDGAVVPYKPASVVHVGGTRDENHDGRPDLIELVARDNGEEGQECEHCGVAYDEQVWLSRTDGTFAPPPAP